MKLKSRFVAPTPLPVLLVKSIQALRQPSPPDTVTLTELEAAKLTPFSSLRFVALSPSVFTEGAPLVSRSKRLPSAVAPRYRPELRRRVLFVAAESVWNSYVVLLMVPLRQVAPVEYVQGHTDAWRDLTGAGGAPRSCVADFDDGRVRRVGISDGNEEPHQIGGLARQDAGAAGVLWDWGSRSPPRPTGRRSSRYRS